MASRSSLASSLPLAALPSELESLVWQTLAPRGPSLPAASSRRMLPPADIQEAEDAYIVHVELPGVPAGKVEVSLEGRTLTVSAQRELASDVIQGDGSELPQVRMLQAERRAGVLSRSFRLPGQVDAGKVSASARDGVVTVTVPKAAEARPLRIEVKPGR